MEVKQNNLINSLRIQPIIVVIRLEKDFFNLPYKRNKLISKINKLSNYGIKNIEIGWDRNEEWVDLVYEIKNNFQQLNIGAASISSIHALDSILSLDLNYCMSPVFQKEVHVEAIKNNQLVIPGVSNIESFKEAINLGYKIIKIFPASKLGIIFLNKLKELNERDIFFIVAGGIRSRDLKRLLRNGYNALAIGKGIKNQIPDQDLETWLKNK